MGRLTASSEGTVGHGAACGDGVRLFGINPVSADNALLKKVKKKNKKRERKKRKGEKSDSGQVKSPADNIITAMTDSDAPWSIYI